MRYAVWAGNRKAYIYEGYPWSPARQGREGQHKISGPNGNLHVWHLVSTHYAYRVQEEEVKTKSFHSWPSKTNNYGTEPA